MKITLVYTGISQIGFLSAGKGIFEQDTRQKALGLCYMGSGLKEKGHEVNLLDLRFLSGYRDYERRLLEFDPDIVGISIQTPSRDYAFECAKRAKGMGKTVVGGGVYATPGHRYMIESGYFDYVVTGEGDISFVELVERLEAGEPPDDPLVEGRIVEDLDGLAFPDIELYDLDFYENLPGWRGFRSPATGLICSRGCPGKCTFCKPLAEKMFGRKMRFRSTENIFAEIEWYVKKFRMKTIHSYDDTFTANKRLLIEFCEKMTRSGLDVDWTINARSDSFTEEVAQALAEGGCKMASFGFESASQWILDFLKKDITVEQSYRAAELCNRYGIRIHANLLVGIPGETDEDYERIYRFIRHVKPDLVYFNTLMPTPGTQIHDDLKAKGLLKEINSFEEYAVSPWHGLIKGVDYDRMRRWERITVEGKFKYYFAPYLERLFNWLERFFSKMERLFGW